ncbi:unnamed protein product [Didymodactylos carnosus]|uniref:Uncharacterized protein n=1 Tax=Didymodactylos carnosus TaxID=1234261 RepID=A0A815XX79_9BILA|nr:unnamed protein product [Didymodactylos carnosus]CAF4424788.1 unnamed protein product [Didymodactylos carnosus]
MCLARNGNLINHIANGKRQRRPERHSMRDYAMQTYHSKLEDVGERALISVLLEAWSQDHSVPSQRLPRGWALPKERTQTRLNPVQIRYLTDKFDQGLKEKIRWKPEEMAAEMQQ